MTNLDIDRLKRELKALVVQECDKDIAPDAIGDDQQLIGGNLDLDSLDALQICVAVGKRYGVRIEGGGAARRALKNIATLAAVIQAGQPR